MNVIIESKLRTIREGRGLTQKNLGILTDLQPCYLSNLESGNITPHVTTAWKIANALGCNIEAIWQMKRGHK